MKKLITYSIILSILLFNACKNEKKNNIKTILPSNEYFKSDVIFDSLKIIKTVYVPIYSHIYYLSGEQSILLTATLSVRNTSFSDSLYVRTVDYYDSHGKLLRNYLKNNISIAPMSSVEFVVENKEDKGGAGANFIVEYGCKNNKSNHLIEAVMIGTFSQQGISFRTQSTEIESKIR